MEFSEMWVSILNWNWNWILLCIILYVFMGFLMVCLSLITGYANQNRANNLYPFVDECCYRLPRLINIICWWWPLFLIRHVLYGTSCLICSFLGLPGTIYTKLSKWKAERYQKQKEKNQKKSEMFPGCVFCKKSDGTLDSLGLDSLGAVAFYHKSCVKIASETTCL